MSSEEEDDDNSDINILSQDSMDNDDEDFDIEDVGSDQEDFDSGQFLRLIKSETCKALKERQFLIKELKAKERRGSIFIDKVNRVVGAVEREPGKYDYLIEWKYCRQDKLTPSTSLVKGGHFAFASPLQYRRFVEENYMQNQNIDTSRPKIFGK